MPIPEQFIDELVARSEISDVVSSYVHLTRKGNNLWGLCPFHNEKTPSFSVSPDKQIYHCYAKQATQLDMNLGTDVIKGLRMYQNGDTKKLAYSINEDKINEVIQAITDATAETYATLGVGMDMKVNEANGEMTINKDGYYENMTIFMDVVMNITDMETSEVDVMNYKIDMNMDCKNPGKEVLFELPSTDGFEELNLLDLTGEEQE